MLRGQTDPSEKTVPQGHKNSTAADREARVRDKLERLTAWKSEELEEEFSRWSPEEILDLWNLLKPVYRAMCRRFGLMRSISRMSIQGIRLHQQINRIGVLQSFALEAEKVIH